MIKKLYNATSHNQSANLQKYRRLGFEIVNPDGMVKPSAPDYSSQVSEGRRVAALIPPASDVLLGGAQIIMEVLFYELAIKNCRFYVAVTERKSDDRGRFIFKLNLVEETFLSRRLGEGRFKILKEQ